MGSVPFLFIAALFFVPNPVTLDVYPPVAMAPATFRFRVIAPRHIDNRVICWGYDGPQLKRSCLTLDGQYDRRVWTVYWDLRVGGEYEASAMLTRVEDGRVKRYSDARYFRVIGLEP